MSNKDSYSFSIAFLLQDSSLGSTCIQQELAQDEPITAGVLAALLPAEQLSISLGCAGCWEHQGAVHARQNILEASPLKGLQSRGAEFLSWGDTEGKELKGSSRNVFELPAEWSWLKVL